MADPESINFLDLACMLKIVPDTTLEKFGSVINASVFDAANITGSLKQKGLIDFTAYYPGPNSIIVAEAGKKLEEEANAKSAEALDNLDEEILRQMSGGKRYPTELQSTLNIRPKDLALRVYKLFKQSYLSYELKNGNVELMLTEQGFLKAKPTGAVQAPVTQVAQQQAQPQNVGQQTSSSQEMAQPTLELKKPKRHMRTLVLVVVVILAIIAVLFYLYSQGTINLPFKLPFSV